MSENPLPEERIEEPVVRVATVHQLQDNEAVQSTSSRCRKPYSGLLEEPFGLGLVTTEPREAAQTVHLV